MEASSERAGVSEYEGNVWDESYEEPRAESCDARPILLCRKNTEGGEKEQNG